MSTAAWIIIIIGILLILGLINFLYNPQTDYISEIEELEIAFIDYLSDKEVPEDKDKGYYFLYDHLFNQFKHSTIKVKDVLKGQKIPNFIQKVQQQLKT